MFVSVQSWLRKSPERNVLKNTKKDPRDCIDIQTFKVEHIPHPFEILLKAVESRLGFVVAEAGGERTERIATVGSGSAEIVASTSTTSFPDG